MVSIVAEEIYNETTTVTHSDRADFHNDSVFSGNEFNAVSISGINQFTYLESLVVELSFDEITLRENGGGSSGDNSPVWLISTPKFEFNGVTNLFADINVTENLIQIDTLDENVSGQVFTNQSGTGGITIDKYIDTPATIQPVLRTETASFGDKTQIDGTQDVDYTIVITAIGRQP